VLVVLDLPWLKLMEEVEAEHLKVVEGPAFND
jgi:hypothetical protein